MNGRLFYFEGPQLSVGHFPNNSAVLKLCVGMAEPEPQSAIGMFT